MPTYSSETLFVDGLCAGAFPHKDHRGLARSDSAQRRMIWDQFLAIHDLIPCYHKKFELALVAEAILTTHVEGPVVEFGCYSGGSTAKLSIIAKHTGRRLYVFDSFEGLPEPRDNERCEQDTRCGYFEWKRGDYSCELDDVVENVRRYGELSVCEFVAGPFEQTLNEFDLEPCVVFEDVDLISSAETVILNCYPQLPKGAVFYSHEAGFLNFVDHFFARPEFWLDHFGHHPPYLVGGLTGLSDFAPALGYFIKPS